ncbi:hypothetical protein SS50377_20368 [Spironucleus salmonicida]|uniref:Uncharacterized protein n=1 Tax=Spironucleus salmonicida TaxID=348837 RepID=V6LEX1_9EUKA|nr:hypothetical protein SS50377_20368 [Spironucleus salmonicida]|eukprot:EST43047.1 Hypothetical protein SS50377_17350 [Spironucleus salmonicida]
MPTNTKPPSSPSVIYRLQDDLVSKNETGRILKKQANQLQILSQKNFDCEAEILTLKNRFHSQHVETSREKARFESRISELEASNHELTRYVKDTTSQYRALAEKHRDLVGQVRAFQGVYGAVQELQRAGSDAVQHVLDIARELEYKVLRLEQKLIQ